LNKFTLIAVLILLALSLLTVPAVVKADELCTATTYSEVNIRTAPGTTNEVVRTTGVSEVFPVLAQQLEADRRWLQVNEGWIAEWVVDDNCSTPTAADQTSQTGAIAFNIRHKCNYWLSYDPNHIPAAGCVIFDFTEISNNLSIGCHNWSRCGKQISALRKDDVVEITYRGQSYHGAVVTTGTVGEYDIWIIDPMPNRTITLFTCAGVNNSQRYFAQIQPS
jgi:hypothetical protein